MSNPQFRVVDNEQPHARDIARQKVKRWRSNADKEKLGTVNIQRTNTRQLAGKSRTN